MLPGLHCLPCTPVGLQIDIAAAKDDDCAICLDSLRGVGPDGSDDVERLVACGHEFHAFCIAGAIQRGGDARCPLCRELIDPTEVARLVAYNLSTAPVAPPMPVPVVGPSPCEQAHGAGWDPTTHWTSLGGWCGQSCPCCRYDVEGPNGFGVCDVCVGCVRSPPAAAANRAGAPTPPTPRRLPAANVASVGPKMSFLYVVARKLGSTPNTRNVGPVLLMMGHRARRSDPVLWPQWGIPGGHYDSTDQGTLFNAAREFVEEMGLLPPARARQRRVAFAAAQAFVKATLRRMFSAGRIFRVVKNTATGYSAYALIVDDALAFERALQLPAAGRDVSAKANVQLSSETVGYTWVAQPTLRNVRRVRAPYGARYSAIRPPTFTHPLRLRRGVVGPQLDRAFALGA